jgi:hypothetical protein
MRKRHNREFSPYEGKSIPQERESLTNLWCHDARPCGENLMIMMMSLSTWWTRTCPWEKGDQIRRLEEFPQSQVFGIFLVVAASWKLHPTRVLKAAGLGREMYCVSQCQLESLLLLHLHWFYTWSIQISFCKCFLLDYYFEAELAKENPLTVFLQSTLPSGPISTPISAIKCFRSWTWSSCMCGY